MNKKRYRKQVAKRKKTAIPSGPRKRLEREDRDNEKKSTPHKSQWANRQVRRNVPMEPADFESRAERKNERCGMVAKGLTITLSHYQGLD